MAKDFQDYVGKRDLESRAKVYYGKPIPSSLFRTRDCGRYRPAIDSEGVHPENFPDWKG